jgi:hypothetical protein
MEDNKLRKKFRDTKVGKFLKDKAPDVLDVVGDLLPDRGVLGVAKNLINMSDRLTPEEKESINEDLLDMMKIEAADRDSARNREIEIAKIHKFDFMFYATGITGLAAFAFIVYAIAFLQIPIDNKETWIHLIGITEGVALSIFGYYFGASIRRNVQ